MFGWARSSGNLAPGALVATADAGKGVGDSKRSGLLEIRASTRCSNAPCEQPTRSGAKALARDAMRLASGDYAVTAASPVATGR